MTSINLSGADLMVNPGFLFAVEPNDSEIDGESGTETLMPGDAPAAYGAGRNVRFQAKMGREAAKIDTHTDALAKNVSVEL